MVRSDKRNRLHKRNRILNSSKRGFDGRFPCTGSLVIFSPFCYIPLTSENRSLQAILSRFYSNASTRPPSPPTATVVPRYLFSLTFPDFDLAPKPNEKFVYCELDLVYRL